MKLNKLTFILAALLLITACNKLEQTPPTTLEMIKAFISSDLGAQALGKFIRMLDTESKINCLVKQLKSTACSKTLEDEDVRAFIKDAKSASDTVMLERFGKRFEAAKCSKVSERYQCVGSILPVMPTTYYFSRDTSGKWMYSEQ